MSCPKIGLHKTFIRTRQREGKSEKQNPKCNMRFKSDFAFHISDLSSLPLLDLNQGPSD
jgi:hypothetical protein